MHAIRLRHPWKSEILPDGLLRYVRKFHRPTGLGDESVTLNLQCVDSVSCSEIRLNGSPLTDSAGNSLRLEVTSELLPFNTLQCEFALASSPDPTQAPSFDQLARAQLEIQQS
ncbi:MAG: hypothetical protein Aurels2KO_17160 [Aureliella sp.]